MTKHHAPKLPAAVLGLLLLGGCNAGIATAGELPTVRMDYNEAIVRSSNEQLLLNVVRLRYLHAPQFFEVTSVTTQSWATGGGSIGLGGGVSGLGDTATGSLSPSLGGNYSLSNRPTISYSPLQGEAFAQRMVRPIQPETLFAMVNVGWRIDRLLGCCVTRINDMSAPVIASTDDRFGGERFRRLGELLYELQIRGALEIGHIRLGDSPELRLTFIPLDDNAHIREMIAQVRQLLNLDPALASYRILPYHLPPRAAPAPPPAAPAGADHIVVRGRSLLGALFYLSHGVQVLPGEDDARSLDYDDDDGTAVHVPEPVPGALLRITASDAAPRHSYVRTYYEGSWYSIADDDLVTKQSFLLLQVLFSVLSASDANVPVLTIPLGS